MKSYISILPIKAHLRDQLYDDSISIKRLDRKIDKIIDNKLTKLVKKYIDEHIIEKGYKDIHDKSITIGIESEIDDNYYWFNININNEYINTYDKYSILRELKHIANMLEYNQEFINKMKNVFLAV
jgi:hypothetical protein